MLFPKAEAAQQTRLKAVPLALVCVGALVFLLPIVFPLGIARDYPNHLARIFIQYRLDQDPLLAANYVLEWRVIPDLAMDLFALPLAGWMSPYLVGGLFNGLTLLLIFTAGIALHRRQAAKLSLWALLPSVLLFNASLSWGFMNFLFGVGLALWMVYFWLESEARPKGRRLLLFAVAQLVLFFAHLLGFLLCGYLILVIELCRAWQEHDRRLGERIWRFMIHMAQFALPLLLLVYVVFFQSGVGDSRTTYGTLGAKVIAFLSPTSAMAYPVGLLTLLAILMVVYVLLRERMATLDDRLKPLLWAMLILVVAMPRMMLGIWGLDFRFPFVALLLLLVAVHPTTRIAMSRLFQMLLLGLITVGFLAGGLRLAHNNAEQQEIRQALMQATPGGALLVAGHYDPGCPSCSPVWLDSVHTGSLAAIERSMFVPLLFTATSLVEAAPGRLAQDVPRGSPVTRQALEEGRDRPLTVPRFRHDPAQPYWHQWPRHFDYLLWMRRGEEDLDDFEELERLTAGRSFVFYRIAEPVANGGSSR